MSNLSSLELRDLETEAGQFFVVGFPGPDEWGIEQVASYVEQIRPFGVILFARNTQSLEEVVELTSALSARFPELAISIDHEGGRVDRMPEAFTKFPPALEIAGREDPSLFREVARAQAYELRSAGIHINFAPVLDIHTNPDNPVIGDRAFGRTPEQVIHNALPYAQGLLEGGVIPCAKHFPGHGDTSCDSHHMLPSIAHEKNRLESLEMVPFVRAIGEGIPMIMTAHVVCEALDLELPASLSRTIVGEWLRERLRYRGVVATDDLDMRAITNDFSASEAAVLAVLAGSDLLLQCNSVERALEAHEGLARAIADQQIGLAACKDAAMRRTRLQKRIRSLASVEIPADAIGAAGHRDLASRCA